MALVRNSVEKNIQETYKMYFETPMKNRAKNRSNSKAKISQQSTSTEKIGQKDKENNYGNVKNGGPINNNSNNHNSNQNGQNNNQNGVYPSNYGLYLSNSSLFSKLGNDIVNSNGKINAGQKQRDKISMGNVNQNQSIKNPKTNVISQANGINPNEMTKNFNSLDKAINNLIDVNKGKKINYFSYNLNDSPNGIDKNEREEETLNQGNKNNENNYDKENSSLMNVSESEVERHLTLIDNIIEMEISVDNKQIMNVLVRKMITFVNEEIIKKNMDFDIFSNTTVSKSYLKIMKISLILLVYFKFILLDFNYDGSLRTNVKKMLNSINDILINITENFILNYIINSNGSNGIIQSDQYRDFMEKYQKVIKLHKIKKNQKELMNSLNKNCDTTINVIKQFSNNYFKIGYFKSIHTVGLEFFRSIENQNTQNLANLIVNHAIFAVIHQNQMDHRNMLPTVSNKQLIFNPANFILSHNMNGPFLIPLINQDKITLVLDLDETLVHFFYTPSGGTFLVRPGAHEFLESMSAIFEIIIFTAAMKDYADNILDVLDKDNKMINHRLYRQHTSISGISFVKDLSKIGRDLSKIIIIDNLSDNFKLQPNNGLAIKSFIDDMKDSHITEIGKILKELHAMNVNDIRPIIKKIKEEYGKRIKKNLSNPYANLDLSKI